MKIELKAGKARLLKSVIIPVILLTLTILGNKSFGQNKIQRAGGPHVKLSLNAYSFTHPLNDKIKGRGKGMSLLEFIDWSAEHNFDAVDLTGYFFPGYPKVPSDEYINNVKRRAFESGLDISGTGVRNDFASPDPEKRAADVKHVKEWIRVAAKLGAPVIRVFAGPVPPGYEDKWDSVATYMAACLKECAEYGKQYGVLVGVQNHGGMIKTAQQALKIVAMVNSDWFGLIVDTGYFISDDPYKDIEETLPYAVNFQLKQSVFGASSKIPIDLKRLMQIVKRSGYRGYLPIETLSPLGGKKHRKQLTAAQIASFPKYDPYKDVPIFEKKVRLAMNAAFE